MLPSRKAGACRKARMRRVGQRPSRRGHADPQDLYFLPLVALAKEARMKHVSKAEGELLAELTELRQHARRLEADNAKSPLYLLTSR